MARKKPTAIASAVSRRKLLQGGAAAFGAAALPFPAIAQTKPFAGVTLHGASFSIASSRCCRTTSRVRTADRHEGRSAALGFPGLQPAGQSRIVVRRLGLRLRQCHILSRRPLGRGGTAVKSGRTDLRSQSHAGGMESEGFVDGAQVPYRDAKGATYGYSWEGGAMVMGLSRMDLMEKKGLKIPKTFAELQQVAPRSTAPTASTASSVSSCTIGACRPTSRDLAATCFAIRRPISCRR